jgi:hypothetical protein
MNFNQDLFITIVVLAIIVETLMVLFLQKIKELPIIQKSWVMISVSFVTNMIFGVLFTLTFTDSNIINGLWMGFISFIGADQLYKLLESKGILKQLKDTLPNNN